MRGADLGHRRAPAPRHSPRPHSLPYSREGQDPNADSDLGLHTMLDGGSLESHVARL